MSRLNRYIFREILSPTLLGLVIYTFVLLMNVIFDVAELAIKKDLPLVDILHILALSMPRLLTLTIPMAVLLGVLIGVGRLSSDSELVAMRACGRSYRRLLPPVLLLGILGWGLTSLLVHVVEPRSNYQRHQIVTRLFLHSDLRKELKSRVFFEDFPGMLLYADKVTDGGSSLESVLLYQNDPDGNDLVTTARRGHLDYERGTGRIRLLLEGGVTHRSDPAEPLDYQVYGADRQMVLKEADEGFQVRLRLLEEPQPKNYREQSLEELSLAWDKAMEIDHEPTRHRVQSAIEVVFQERFAIPLACLVFSFIGFPLGIFNQRGGKSSGVVLSLGVVLAYWLLLTAGANLAAEGKISPLVGLWTGNVLFAVAGALLLYRRERQESGRRLRGGFGWLLDWLRKLKNSAAQRRLHRAQKGGSSESVSTPDPADSEPVPTPRGGWTLSNLIDRYILRSFLKFLAFTGLSIYIIFVMVEFRSLLDELLAREISSHLLFDFFKYRTPWVANQILPVACLVSTLLCFGVLSRFNEVTAFKAGGMSLYRLSLPVLGCTLVLSVFSYYVQDYIMPFSNQRASQIRDQIRGRAPRSYSQPERRWILGTDGLFYNYQNYTRPGPQLFTRTASGTFQGFTVYRMDPDTFAIQERVYAREASWKDDGWVLKDGWERQFDNVGNVTAFNAIEESSFPFQEKPDFFLEENRTPDQMSFWQLRDFVLELRGRGYSVQELSVSLHEKLAFPFVSLVMVVLGLPFAFRTGRRGSLYGIGLSIGLVVIYYATFAVTSALGEIGFLPPLLAAWAPNVLFAGTGTYLMLSTVRT